MKANCAKARSPASAWPAPQASRTTIGMRPRSAPWRTVGSMPISVAMPQMTKSGGRVAQREKAACPRRPTWRSCRRSPRRRAAPSSGASWKPGLSRRNHGFTSDGRRHALPGHGLPQLEHARELVGSDMCRMKTIGHIGRARGREQLRAPASTSGAVLGAGAGCRPACRRRRARCGRGRRPRQGLGISREFMPMLWNAAFASGGAAGHLSKADRSNTSGRTIAYREPPHARLLDLRILQRAGDRHFVGGEARRGRSSGK